MDFFHTHITEKAKQLALECLESGRLSEGRYVVEFEQELENVFGYENVVTVNSGTSALHLALLLSGVGAGDEVIIPAQTFVATGLAVLYCGAKVVFADIEKETGNIDAYDVVKKITPETKAIICVSWGGNPCNLEYLSGVCEESNISLIQDNAQALGSFYNDFPVTLFGDFSCFSFQAIKHLTTGDGGLLTCKNPIAYQLARNLRWFGIDREDDLPGFDGERVYDLWKVGYKYHMNNLSAAVGLGNLDGIWDRLDRVNQIADYYDENLPEYKVEKSGSSNWLYTLLVDERDSFILKMRENEIPVSVVHNGIHKNTVFFNNSKLPNQRYWDEHHICIPCHYGLTDEDVEKIVDTVRGGW